MPEPWPQGRGTIEQMLYDRQMERVFPNRDYADSLIAEARSTLALAERDCDNHPRHAYSTMYEAARFAMTAILENQGLRPTSRGGHIGVYEAVFAQLGRSVGRILRPFDEMRRVRHTAEYPAPDDPLPTPEEVREAIPEAEAIIDLAEQVLDQMPPF